MVELNDIISDEGLEALASRAENLYILTGDPGLTWSNIATLSCGTKASPTISAPQDRSLGGREAIISNFTDGLVICTGTKIATHWAVTDDSETTVLVSQELSESFEVVNGEIFSLTEISVAFADPT